MPGRSGEIPVPRRMQGIQGLGLRSAQRACAERSARVQLDLATFVQRSGSGLTLGGAPFKFAGATNYYMLTRAADRETRHQVRAAPPAPPTDLPPLPSLRSPG